MTLEKVSHYDIIETLGAGGMGIVFKGYDTILNRHVAVKTLARHIAHHPDFRKRFVFEAKAAAAINHPNIATIYEILEEGNDAYIVMEFIEGEELSKKISDRNLKLKEALDYAIQIAEGLREAHSKGIIHRDIKSANIMVTGNSRIKIMDFGLAKLSGQTGITQIGTTMGTINYMSPEQARGEESDYRTDLWALGVIMYEMITGKLPFKGDYEQAVIYSILNEQPKEINKTDENFREDVCVIINKLLAKLPEDRYQNADELLLDLKAVQQSVETGIPAELLRSGTIASEYISKLKLPAKSLPFYKDKRILIISLAVIFFIVLPGLIFTTDVLQIFSGTSEKHIAVLPFTNIGSDSENQAFADGLMETLTSKISQLEQFDKQLWVVPASEIRTAEVASAKDAFNKFGVNMVISGSIEKTTNGYRVNINLIDAQKLRQLESSKIDNPMTGASFIQDEAIIKVAEMLNVELKPESLEKLKAGETKNPKAYELYLKGRGTLFKTNLADNVTIASNFFDEAIKIDSSFALAYSGLTDSYLRRYVKTKEVSWIGIALKNCNKALDIDKTLIPIRITLSSIYNLTGKHQEALDELQKVLELDPNSTDAYLERAKAFMAVDKNEEAEYSYKKAISIKPNYWRLYNTLGYFYFRQGKYQQAIAQYQRVITITPNNSAGYRNLGSMYFSMNRYDDAIKMYEKSLEIEVDYRTYNNLAAIYTRKGDWNKAVEIYEKILEIRNTDHRIWGYLADAYYMINAPKTKIDSFNLKAISLAELQLNINQNDISVLGSLAYYYAMLGNRHKALSLLRKLESLNPSDVYVQYLISTIYELWLKDRTSSIIWLKKALINGYPLDDVKTNPGMKGLLADKEFNKFLFTLREANQ